MTPMAITIPGAIAYVVILLAAYAGALALFFSLRAAKLI